MSFLAPVASSMPSVPTQDQVTQFGVHMYVEEQLEEQFGYFATIPALDLSVLDPNEFITESVAFFLSFEKSSLYAIIGFRTDDVVHIAHFTLLKCTVDLALHSMDLPWILSSVQLPPRPSRYIRY